jgi:L-arabinose isomerase
VGSTPHGSWRSPLSLLRPNMSLPRPFGKEGYEYPELGHDTRATEWIYAHGVCHKQPTDAQRDETIAKLCELLGVVVVQCGDNVDVVNPIKD